MRRLFLFPEENFCCCPKCVTSLTESRTLNCEVFYCHRRVKIVRRSPLRKYGGSGNIAVINHTTQLYFSIKLSSFFFFFTLPRSWTRTTGWGWRMHHVKQAFSAKRPNWKYQAGPQLWNTKWKTIFGHKYPLRWPDCDISVSVRDAHTHAH